MHAIRGMLQCVLHAVDAQNCARCVALQRSPELLHLGSAKLSRDTLGEPDRDFLNSAPGAWRSETTPVPSRRSHDLTRGTAPNVQAMPMRELRPMHEPGASTGQVCAM